MASEHLMIEGGCGEMSTFAGSMATYKCGYIMRSPSEKSWSRALGDEALHPWRYAKDREDV